jgi:hypothetical protein
MDRKINPIFERVKPCNNFHEQKAPFQGPLSSDPAFTIEQKPQPVPP